ncbi:Apoptosis-inducing factor 1 [Malassezia nana]|uniref:Apoptosis-inducing factor 1 n=1 Tax=Malassezia nana TaxID=180528 RepID=A0AAF0J1F6_9BASI|nr:Apoptosis-inducing factor 1 [Malassezia nana]
MREVPLDAPSDVPVNAIVANVHGSFYATTSRCTHYGMPLSKGVLTDDGKLYCPFHGACFRVTTGDIEDAPALEPLQTFEVEVKDDQIYLLVDYEALKNPPPSLCPSSEKDKRQGHHTVFIGGGAVTLHAVQEMRRLGYKGQITVLTSEPHPTIDRPRLSKSYAPALKQTVIYDESYWRDTLQVDLRLSSHAYMLDTRMKRIHVRGGNTLIYDNLVLATGSVPRRLPIEGAMAQGVYVLRSHQDAESLTAALKRRAAPKLVIIGTGFIGLEMGIALAKHADVTLLGQTHVPLEGPLGRQVGSGLQTAIMNERPLRFMNAVDVVRIETDMNGYVRGVVVQPRARGSPELFLQADMVLMSTGARPATDFLRNSPSFPGLRPDGSVEVDSALRVLGLRNVYAGGDIAAYPTENGLVRVEHWNVASNHGRAIGRMLATGHVRAYKHVPVFWSSLTSTLRYAGSGQGYTEVYVDGEPDEAEFIAYYAKNDKVIAVATMWKDPMMVQAVALMQAGKMPKLSVIKAGLDIMTLSTAPVRRL